MSVEVRRRAAENAFQRARDAGHAVELDEQFHAWIEQWIAGDIEMPEVAKRYRSLLGQRAATRRDQAAAAVEDDLELPNAPGAKQSLDLETEINRLMDEEEKTPKD